METETVKVHYVGRGVYNEEKFIKEAEEIGVSRALPLYMIKKLKEGQRVYLAQWKKTGTKDFPDRQGFPTKNVGDARIFGYFFVDGFNLPADIMNEVRLLLPCSEPTEANISVSRECGEYVVVSSCSTTASLQEIVDVLEEIISDMKKKYPHRKIKTMVTGRFIKLAEPIIMNDELFCRTLRTMEIPVSDEDTESASDETELNGIDNYEQITYYPKGDKVVGSN